MGKSSKLVSVALPLATMIATTSQADEFDFAVGFDYFGSRADSSFAQTLSGGERIQDDIETDTDSFALFGRWYFAGLSDDPGPRARAEFVDRASFVNVGYVRSDVSTAIRRSSTLPFLPSSEFGIDQTVDTYAVDLRLVDRDSGWFGEFGLAELDPDSGFPSSTAVRAGVGKYFLPTTAVSLSIVRPDADESDPTLYSLTLNHVGRLGADWQYSADLGYSRNDLGSTDLDAWRGAFAVYPNTDLEFGIAVDYTERPSNLGLSDGRAYEGFASWFVTPGIQLAARYKSFDEAGLAGTAFFFGSAVDTIESSSDQDEFGVSINVRF